MIQYERIMPTLMNYLILFSGFNKGIKRYGYKPVSLLLSFCPYFHSNLLIGYRVTIRLAVP